MNRDEEKAFREYEKEIDSFHKSLPLWKYPKDKALYGLLSAFDSFLLVQVEWAKERNGKPATLGVSQYFKLLNEGLVYAMRWLHSGEEQVDATPTNDVTLVTDAAQFIQHGSDYDHVSRFYMEHSRGWMRASVDQASKSVRFAYDESKLRPESIKFGFAENIAVMNKRFSSTEDRLLSSLLERSKLRFAQVPHHYENGRIVLDNLSNLSSNEVMNYMELSVSPESNFPPDTDLQGFTMRDFNAFWRALRAWSDCCSCLYLWAWEQGVEQEECMPTQVVLRGSFINQMSFLSGLDNKVVEAILKRLTYDNRTTKPDIFLQPFVCGSKTVSWSTSVPALSRHERNMLKLMTRTPAYKAIADNIIGNREREFLKSFGLFLAQKAGWQFKLLTKLHGGTKGDIDLLGYNRQFPTEVLVVESKVVLEADEISELDSATSTMIHGQEQLERNIGTLQEMPIEQKQRLFRFVDWEKVNHYYGIVLTPETEPHLEVDHSVFPCAALSTLEVRMRWRDWRQPSRVWESVKERRWLQSIRRGRHSHSKVTIGNITYELPKIDFPENNRNTR